MTRYDNAGLTPGRWVSNGKGTVMFVPDQRRACIQCGSDITFAEDSWPNRCTECRSTGGPRPKRHPEITDELEALFKEVE